MMQLNGLPADLAQFVQDALASGQYQSAEELICEALRVLREYAHSHGVHMHPDEAHPESPPQSADAYVCAIAHALSTGEFGQARQLALEGAERYPTHVELTKSARVLAPPTVTRARHPHTAVLQANRAWLKAHRQDYAGQWIALRDGHLLVAAPSFEQLVAHVDETHDVLLTKLPA